MAQGIQLEQARFCCAICLDLLNDPVTIPCGHSYCLNCIKEHLEAEDGREIYTCPECRQILATRPVLVKNNLLAFVVEELKKTGLQAPPSPDPRDSNPEDVVSDVGYAGLDDVACDVCTGRKRKAVKSCLQCWVSYCEEHLRPHYEVGPLKKHKLVEASAKIQDHICSRHQEVMKLFCRTDQTCICYLCSKDEHKGHEKVSAAAERAEKQIGLEKIQEKIHQKIREKQKDLTLFEQEEDAVNTSAETALKNNERIFTELISVIERRLSDARLKITARQKTEVGRFQKAREKVGKEIGELKSKDAELEKLSNSEDHTEFLLNYPTVSQLNESKDVPSVKVRRLRYFEKVTAALSEAKDTLQEVLGEECAKISMSLSEANVVESNPNMEPKTRADFLQYACPITLAHDTANTHILICNGDRKAAFTKEEQAYLPNRERFAYSWQVLSKERLTGRCYWEVERSGRGVLVAVAYEDISRSGTFNECVFGFNAKSWALDCYKNSYEYRHNNKRTAIPGFWSGRVGVYLDHSKGVLSFYSVSEKMDLLKRVKTKFTQPLYAGLWLSEEAVVEICKLK